MKTSANLTFPWIRKNFGTQNKYGVLTCLKTSYSLACHVVERKQDAVHKEFPMRCIRKSNVNCFL